MFKLYRQHNDVNTIANHYYKDRDYGDTSGAYYKSFQDAVQELTRPYSRKAFFVFAEKFQFYNSQACKISVAWKRSYPILLAIPMRMDFPYRDLINYTILKRINQGFLSKIRDDYYGSKDTNCGVEVQGAVFDLVKVFGIFICLACGMCLAVLLFLMEMFRKCLSRLCLVAQSGKSCLLVEETSEIIFEQELRALMANWGPAIVKDRKDFENDVRFLIDCCRRK